MSLSQSNSDRVRVKTLAEMLELRRQLRALYDENATDEEIGKQLSMSRSAVTRMRNDMGLMPRWGRKNGHVFTPQNDLDLLDLRANTKLSWSQVALCMDFPVTVLYARHEMLLTRASQMDRSKYEQIRCMQCRQMFFTPNRRQIHSCDACHQRINGMGAQYYDL